MSSAFFCAHNRSEGLLAPVLVNLRCDGWIGIALKLRTTAIIITYLRIASKYEAGPARGSWRLDMCWELSRLQRYPKIGVHFALEVHPWRANPRLRAGGGGYYR